MEMGRKTEVLPAWLCLSLPVTPGAPTGTGNGLTSALYSFVSLKDVCLTPPTIKEHINFIATNLKIMPI